MNILIIGGTGLISIAITRQLLERGDTVTHYNRAQQGRYPVPPEVRQITGDRTDYAAFEQAIAAQPPFDCVIDMIGYAPEDAASAARAFRGRTGHFIFCSTVDVYQKPATRYPYVEDEPYGGLNAYSRNKVVCEQTLRVAHERGDFPLTIIRPACTYGEGSLPLNPLGGGTAYVDRIRTGKPIVVHGDGSSLWTVCHRDDVARAFVAAAGQPHTFGRQYHTPGEDWMTWDVYHQRFAAALGAPPPTLVHIPTDLLAQLAPRRASIIAENFQFNNIFDTGAARRDLGFAPTISWEDGARRMVGWLDERGKIASAASDTLDDRLITAWERLRAGIAAEVGG